MESVFRKNVYQILRKVPSGKVVTYGQLAELAGNSGAARAVGMCMRTNPDAPQTPCHRVVSSTGELTGYSAQGGIQRKKDMLQEEGVYFIGDRVDLSRSQWQPDLSEDLTRVYG